MPTDLHDDDAPIGRLLTRREILITLGGAGASGLLLLAGCGQAGVSNSAVASSTPAGTAPERATTTAQLDCVAKPEMTQGPYFVDEKLNRSDVRSEPATGAVKAGALFALTFNVSRIQPNACSPLPNAIVDIWQCDALGVYSDASDPSFNTIGQKWLRGHQVTDASGTARLTTIIPGWYPGRASHIHFKIRGNSGNGDFDFTSQLFFPEEFLSSVYSQPPYSSRVDSGRRRNATDGIFRRGGSQLLLAPEATSSGYSATFNLGLNV